MLVTGGFAFFIMCIIFGAGFWWGYNRGKDGGYIKGRTEGFLQHEEMVTGRIVRYFPEQERELMDHLLA